MLAVGCLLAHAPPTGLRDRTTTQTNGETTMTSKWFARALRGAAFVAIQAGIVTSEATTLRPQNLVALIENSQMILAGHVDSVSDGIAENGLPYTEVTLSIGESVKG